MDWSEIVMLILCYSKDVSCLMIPWLMWTGLSILLVLAAGVAQTVVAANIGAPAWYFAAVIIGNLQGPLYPIFTVYLLYLIKCLEGQSHKIFCIQFIHQTAPSGPIRTVQGLFRFFCYFIELLDSQNNSLVSQ